MKLRLILPSLFMVLPLFGQNFIPPAQSGRSTPGDRMLADYFRNETAALSASCLADIKTAEDWTGKRGEYRRQLQEMLGLWPMPERGDLKAVVTGVITNDEFTVEKISFQASPGLYCTADLYLPKNLSSPAPTILYECGHLRQMTNGISLGNKSSYQADGPWFARNGYVCLVMDSLRDGEISGIHTGTRDLGLWWWNSRGYTPAGVEAWFGIRALDYLCTRPEVDTNRFGITGHSGGGAYSWTVTALDDRIKAAAPLAGMTDLKHHIAENLMDSHCDCNFFINIYRWDFPQLAALAAPRPLLIGGTDNDGLFPVESTVDIYDKLKRVYQILNASSNLALTLGHGPHDEVPELRLAVLRWFNRNLKGITKEKETPIVVDGKRFFAPTELKVFETLPADSINSNIADTFVPLAKLEKKSPDELSALLRQKVFAGWPETAPPLNPKQVFSVTRDDVRFSAWDFTSEHDVTLRLYLLEDAKTRPAQTVQLRFLDTLGWIHWRDAMRDKFANELADEIAQTNVLHITYSIANSTFLEGFKHELSHQSMALAFFAPRGVGLTEWSGAEQSGDDKRLTRIRRRFMLLGQTLDGMRVWDIRRAIQTLEIVRDRNSARVELFAAGVESVNALYATLFEPAVRKLDLMYLPKSQTAGYPDYLGVLKWTDIPQVLEAVKANTEVNEIEIKLKRAQP